MPANWDLLPSGLGPGDEFRLLIVTSTTRNAESTGIADYDAHVQSAVATNGHVDIQDYSGGFRVLGSTETVNARDHTETRDTDTSVPIYYLNGGKVADDYADLYDGSWDSHVPRDESGSEIGAYDPEYPAESAPYVWTGTNSDGTRGFHGTADAYLGFEPVLAQSIFVIHGRPRLSGSEVDGRTDTRGKSFSFYGLSEVFVVPVPSADATLRSLKLSNGTLGPTFSSNTFDYTASVAPTATSTRVTARTTDSGAKAVIKLGGVTDTDGTVDLAVGANTITVEVTAEDTTSKLTYTVTVTRPHDATLSGLALEDNNDAAVALTPAFDPATLSYRASVVNSVDEITIGRTENDGNANSEIQDGNGIRLTDADPDKAGFQVELSEGNNTIRVQVAAGHDTTLTYTVTVKRGIDPCPPAAISTVTLVANTGETRQSGGSDDVSAQSFRTGPEPTGYTISEVRLGIVTGVGRNTNVSIREDDNGTPGTFVKHLSHLTLGNSGVFPFRGPTDLILEPATTYWITVNEGYANEGSPNPVSFQRISSNAQTREPGWSIGDDRLTSDQDSGPWITETSSLAIEIHGTVGDTARIASLVDLELTDESGRAVALDPPFSCDQHEYEASAVAAASQVRVSVTASVADASIRYWDSVRNSAITESRFNLGHQVDLVAGMETEIRVRVTATGRNNSRTYRVIASRPPRVLVSTKSLSVTEGEGAGVSGYTLAIDGRPAANVTVSIVGTGGTPVNTNPESVTFSASDWNRPRNITVWADADSNNTNEVVRLTHTVSGLDGITIPSVIVNVDDQDAPDYHIRQITLPPGSHALLPGEKPLPEEEINDVLIYLPYVLDVESDVEGIPIEIADPIDGVYNDYIQVVAEGHIWRPSGLWGDPGEDTVWVVDPSHYGIHALKLSKLKEGLIERRVAADTSGLEQRLNYQCHFEPGRASGDGNPSLTVMWGTSSDLWIPNDSSGTIDAYSRSYSLSRGCYTRHVTAWATDLQSYETADEHFQSPFEFVAGIDVSGGPLTIRGIWASSGRVWISGPSSGLSAGDVYAFNLSPNYSVDIAAGYDGHGASYGLWSDGTTMWVATDSGWLRAYDLDTGVRSAEFDIRIRTHGMPPGDIWSDGGTIWVTNRGGEIDAYLLPDRPYTRSAARATEAGPLTASFALAPEAHDGESGFRLRIAFSDDVEITPEDMRDHALLVSGGAVTGAARVKDRSDLWELTVEPDGPGPVSILAPLGRACTDQGALCTADGRSLTAGPALVVPGPLADSPPGVPDQPAGTAVFIGGVDLEWNEVPGAESYDVQLGRGGQWIDLPGGGVEVAFYGAGAIISGLDPEATLWFQVRAANGHGVSDWSATLAMSSTSQFKLGRKARRENEPASGAPVVHGTARVGESLWGDVSGIEDGNGLNRVEFQYQWTSNDGSADADIAGATKSGYTLVADDEGKTIKVEVAFTDRGGYSETRTSAATEAVAAKPDRPATGEPTIIGTAQVGETLTADTSGIADADGLSNVSYGYQWVGNDGSSDTDITGATDASYTLVADDEGSTIKVRVIVTDDAGNETTLTSAATEAVAAKPDRPATGEPTIIGTAQVGETLTADTSGIADADGLSNVSYGYQWVGNDGSSDTDITGATDASYTLVADDEGSTIKVRVIVTDDAGNETTLTSAATEAVAARPNTSATGVPTIRGTAQVGEVLTADTTGITDADGLDSAVFAYQWLSDDAEIGGATGSAYTLVAADEGRTIKVRVIVTDDLGNETTLTSAATEAVAAKPDRPATGLPTIGGTAEVGETLTADTSGITDADGLTKATYGYQWVANDGTTDTDISGATDASYTLVADDEGSTIKVRVIVTDDAGNEERLTSAATEAVASGGPTEPPGRPLKLKGVANADGTVTLSWEAPEDESVTGYQILRKRTSRGEQTLLVHVNDTGSTGTEYTDSEVTPDVLHAYRVKAINAAGVSKRSNVVRVTPVEPEQPSGNTSATGRPSIVGTVRVGETLTADTSGIADADGLDNVSYSYQWVVTDGGGYLDISGATGGTYTLVAIDRGLYIQVRVSFTDDAGNGETLTSAATEAVAAAP